jgi:hypothetical protein
LHPRDLRRSVFHCSRGSINQDIGGLSLPAGGGAVLEAKTETTADATGKKQRADVAKNKYDVDDAATGAVIGADSCVHASADCGTQPLAGAGVGANIGVGIKIPPHSAQHLIYHSKKTREVLFTDEEKRKLSPLIQQHLVIAHHLVKHMSPDSQFKPFMKLLSIIGNNPSLEFSGHDSDYSFLQYLSVYMKLPLSMCGRLLENTMVCLA